MTLRKLIETVEAGTATMNDFAAAFPSETAYGKTTWGTAHKAYRNSLDAAKALHDALLPEWEWACGWNDGEYLAGVAENNLPDSKNVCHEQPNPARAWLLAILRAMEAEGRE